MGPLLWSFGISYWDDLGIWFSGSETLLAWVVIPRNQNWNRMKTVEKMKVPKMSLYKGKTPPNYSAPTRSKNLVYAQLFLD